MKKPKKEGSPEDLIPADLGGVLPPMRRDEFESVCTLDELFRTGVIWFVPYTPLVVSGADDGSPREGLIVVRSKPKTSK